MPGDTAKKSYHTSNNGMTTVSPDEDEELSNQRGRPSLSKYEVSDSPEFAFTTERIEENYPFFGRLHRFENGHFKLKQTVKKEDERDIEWVDEMYGSGKYQLRLKKDGKEHRIDFKIPEDEPENSRTKSPLAQESIVSLRKEIKEEIRSDYESDINRLERRNDALSEENDELARKLRLKTQELAEAERRAALSPIEERNKNESKVDRLKEKIQDYKFKVFKLEQQLEYADVDKDFSFFDMLKKAATDPDVVEKVTQMFGGIYAQMKGNGKQVPPPALNGATENGATENGATINDQFASDNPESPQSGQQESEHELTKEQQMALATERFKKGVIQAVAQSMLHGEPEPQQLKVLINDAVAELKDNEIEIIPGMWVNISRQLIDFAIEHDIQAKTAAEKIIPVVDQFEGAKEQLKWATPKMAADYLIGRFKIDVNEEQKEYLIGVLKVFKESIEKPKEEPA